MQVELIIHSHLESEERFEVGWSPKYLDESDKSRAENLRCLEIRIGGLKNDESYDAAMETLTEVAQRLSIEQIVKAYLVLLEDQTLPRNRVRSHKGLFEKGGQIKQGDYTEHEVSLEENWSLFTGMATITEANIDECLSLAREFYRAFIILSGEQTENIYGREFLESLVTCLSIKGSIWVNYMKLIPKVCEDGLMVLAFGAGDTRGEYANLKLFFHKDAGSFVQEAASRSVHSAAA